ncbi:MAG: hypothetical protein DCC52_19165 [Chloroflexi bacterium]|nr:MAG: hypothetical protein DCC52_19165 [Chloroflexota bacterium]
MRATDLDSTTKPVFATLYAVVVGAPRAFSELSEQTTTLPKKDPRYSPTHPGGQIFHAFARLTAARLRASRRRLAAR